MYAFGAASAYMLVFVSLLVLRFIDPWTPRPFKVPFNIPISGKDGERRLLPLAGILGFLGISSILILVVLMHSIGRIAGPAWIVMGLLIFFIYRRHRKLPLFKSLKRNWEKEQLHVYEDAGEHDLAEEFRENLARKERLNGEHDMNGLLPHGTKVLDVPVQEHNNHHAHRNRQEDAK
jgi:APA family basic amino acid/polyamine antiporter